MDYSTKLSDWRSKLRMVFVIGVMGSTVMLLLLSTYLRVFAEHISTIGALAFLISGLGICGHGLLGSEPNFGPLALFVLFFLNVSVVVLAHRVAVSALLTTVFSLCFVVLLLGGGPGGEAYDMDTFIGCSSNTTDFILNNLTAAIGNGTALAGNVPALAAVLHPSVTPVTPLTSLVDGDPCRVELVLRDALERIAYLVIIILAQAWSMFQREKVEYVDFYNRELNVRQQARLNLQKEQTSEILRSLLPPSVVVRLIESEAGGDIIMDKFEEASRGCHPPVTPA